MKARNEAWPKIEEARRQGKIAFLSYNKAKIYERCVAPYQSHDSKNNSNHEEAGAESGPTDRESPLQREKSPHMRETVPPASASLESTKDFPSLPDSPPHVSPMDSVLQQLQQKEEMEKQDRRPQRQAQKPNRYNL